MSKFFGVNSILDGITINDYYPDKNDTIKSLEKAASIHKEVRRHLYNYIKPNIKLIDIKYPDTNDDTSYVEYYIFLLD